MSAPFSPTMIDGALVLAAGMIGTDLRKDLRDEALRVFLERRG